MVDLNLGSFCFRFVRVHFWSEVGLGASKAPPITDTAFCRDFSFRVLFSRLPIDHVIYLVRLLLLEQKVVLYTSEPRGSAAILAHVAEAARALLFPFEWVHTYNALLPPCMSPALRLAFG